MNICRIRKAFVFFLATAIVIANMGMTAFAAEESIDTSTMLSVGENSYPAILYVDDNPVVKTSDEMKLLLWIGVLAAAVIAAIVLIIINKKRKK